MAESTTGKMAATRQPGRTHVNSGSQYNAGTNRTDAGGSSHTVAALAMLLLAAASESAFAQAPYVVGTWKLNVAESRLPPGPPPKVHVRRYSLASDGTLVGLAVIVDAAGNPSFLQFAAKADGKDYAEFDSRSLAALQIDGAQPNATYSETPVDSHTVVWTDKRDGVVTAEGRKWVAADGKTLSFTVEGLNGRGERQNLLFVFDRQDRKSTRLNSSHT